MTTIINGSSPSITFSDGSQQVTAAAGPNVQRYTTAGTYTFTIPDGITKLQVAITGGGGGGGGARATPSNCQTSEASGGNGGGGGNGVVWLTGLTPGANVTVTVGAAGTAGNTTPTNGGAGGTSSFGAFITATGGSGGQSATATAGQSIIRATAAAGTLTATGYTTIENWYPIGGSAGSGGYVFRNAASGVGTQAGSAGTAGQVLIQW